MGTRCACGHEQLEIFGLQAKSSRVLNGLLGRSVLKTVWNAPPNIHFFYKRNYVAPDPASKPEGKRTTPEQMVPKRSEVKKKPVANRFAFLFDDED